MVMQHAGGRGSRRGTGALGCLVWIVVVGAAAYYGGNVGRLYWNFYNFQEEMKTQARLAPSLADTTIRRRIVEKAQSLKLPDDAARVRIQRLERESAIVIEAIYRDSVDLPLLKKGFDFHPRAKEAL
ncbi:MAG: hypothetical protein NW201_09930 [Gemmatimonadales bacterium]|nr:hypothetical protein [Gemmatimonadales bacterium]